MSKYNNSKIYKIIDNTNGNIYIGSTIQKYITTRLAGHVGDYKSYLNNNQHYMASFEIIKNANYDIILIENINCETKEQLHARERFYIESMDCINKNIPGRTKHEYYIKNKETILTQYKNEIAEKKKKKFTCTCGSECRISEKARHERTIKHQTYLKNQAILVPVNSTFATLYDSPDTPIIDAPLTITLPEF
jgi:hypothetical protein